MAKTKIVYDDVEYPRHYVQGSIETLDFIIDKNFGYLDGNVIKYLVRYRHKEDPIKDLKKARFYLNKLIDLMEDELE
jgi:adenine-specific DNA glycosylase